MVDVVALRALRSVAAVGTLAQAAEDLGFTASAVSQQIKRLERQVGVPLLVPAGRGVLLTPAGKALVGAAPDVFQALERCVEAARSVSEGAPRGVLRVVAFSTAIRGLLAPAVLRLNARFPELRVQLTEQDPEPALHCVDVGTADLALVHDADGLPAPLPSSSARRHVHTDVGDVVMHAHHPLARLDRPLTAADLVGHAWVTSPPGTVCYQWFRRLFADVPSEPDVRHQVDDFATQLSLVASDGVLALIPRLARAPLGTSTVAVPLQRRPTRDVTAAWRRSASASPAIRALLGELAPSHDVEADPVDESVVVDGTGVRGART